MKPNAVFSNLITGNGNSDGQSNISLPAPSPINVRSNESNRAIQNLNSRFAVDETKREKTPADFLRQILIEQPIGSSNAKPEPLEMKLDKPPQKLTAADYNRAAWRAVFKKAGYGILTDGEIQQAVGAMRDNKLKAEFEGFNINNLRRYDAQPGPMFLDVDKGTIESAKRAGQAVLQYQEDKAKQSDANQEKAQNEVNQMFADQGRVLWNSTVNIAEGIVNTTIDAALTNSTNPLPLLNPNRPQVDFSSAKSDYRSEMMRRDLHGKLDGDGIKAGQFIEIGVTIAAPLIIGKVTAPTQLTELNLVSTEKPPIGLFSSKSLEGIEKATPKLISAIEKKGRTVVIAKEGSEELRFLNFFNAEANAGGVGNAHIILRENPSKAALLEEFLHGTQSRLGIINKLGDVGAEIHVKGFMIRHHRMLGLIDEDVEILKMLKVLEQRRVK